MAETAIATPTPRPQAPRAPRLGCLRRTRGVPSEGECLPGTCAGGTGNGCSGPGGGSASETSGSRRSGVPRNGARGHDPVYHFLPQGHYDWTKPPPKHLKD